MSLAAMAMIALPALLWLPLSGAALAFLLGRQATPWLPLAALLGSAATALTIAGASGADSYAIGGWMPPLGIAWRLDRLSAAMLSVTALVSIAVGLFSAACMPRTLCQTEWFWPLLLLLLAGLNALFLTRDAFNAYVALEVISLAAVALVTLEGSRAQIVAGMRYLLVALAGSLLYLLGVVLLYRQFGTLDFAIMAASAAAESAVPPTLALALATIGLFAKAAFFPLHIWLPPAHGSAPAPASAMLSALVVKAGFYLLLRLWFDVAGLAASGAMEAARTLIGLCGVGAVLWGSVLALRQSRLKPLLAYSTVAQLGYLLLLFPLADTALAWRGVVTLVAAHALAKAAMFLSAGVIIHTLGHDRITGISGAARAVPMTIFSFGLAGMSLIGLPPSGGFVAKWLLMTAAFDTGRWWWSLTLLAGGMLAAAYVFLVLARAFANPTGPGKSFDPVPRLAELSALGLALGSFALGFAGEALP